MEQLRTFHRMNKKIINKNKKKTNEMTIEPVELCISILPNFKASRNLFFFCLNES